ncbi:MULTISPECIES: DNA adenine methylase [Muribaculaceae]|jgi:site-specific DNA-adenine methylase|uniref:DNA adenine methylase n=1 Tax=Lepagella muris TaxID=3032870 RepID=A0AC61RH09_9BACT|nr:MULTISPECIES: DNA adenine methylase [Muribaculaceae]TGY80234.1 DNA adenine methylase [Lepagella muris]THG52773.1 DNA adenine methylase [Bacteroidales bacterium]TKC54101.1 DNA adenine methylase [Bacteroidales bacterium]
MSRLYLSAPLPFVGQKRMFAKHFIEVVRQYPAGTVFVDLFGGSGLLSHITKHIHPASRVIYNDFDNYRRRIEEIPRTNALLDRIRPIASRFPRHKPVTGEAREEIFRLLEQEERETGYLDFITLSSSLMFSMKYKMSIPEMRRETLYNNVRKTGYAECPDYLAGLEIESCDYRELFERFRNMPGVVFLVDPPYLSTEVGTYRMSWRLADYLDVLSVLSGHDFVYFTSDKSSLVELCEWMGRNPSLGNPFERCRRREFDATMNYNARYTDIMLFTELGNAPEEAV